MKDKLIFCGLLLILCHSAYTQDLDYVKKQVQLLTSPSFYGRGYVNDGDVKAGEYLATEFGKHHLESFGKNYYQSYSFRVNTFPGAMEVKINHHKLIPGTDYIVYPPSGNIRGVFDIERFDSTIFQHDLSVPDLVRHDFSHKFILLDTVGWSKKSLGQEIFSLVSLNSVRAAGILRVTDKDLVFSVSQYQLNYGCIEIRRNALPKLPERIKIHISSDLENHKTNNIIGYIRGETDTFMVITAHYDHLGMMGKSAYFPGANDNASGTAMLLDLLQSLTTGKKYHYSYAFMLFSGEEAGLLGSGFYTLHPLFPLTRIKMLVNLDMVATGSGGITVFNGSNYPKEFAKLDSINKVLNLRLPLKAKGISKASDHYPFYVNHVPVLYFTTAGKETGYHSTDDTYERLPFTVYNKLFQLVYGYLKIN